MGPGFLNQVPTLVNTGPKHCCNDSSLTDSNKRVLFRGGGVRAFRV